MKRGQNAKPTADKKILAILGPQPVETYDNNYEPSGNNEIVCYRKSQLS